MSFRNPRVVLLSGSSKVGSLNSRLVGLADRRLRQMGAECTVVEPALVDSLPMFSETVEQTGKPAELVTMKQMFREADGLLIASPEYNGSMTPLLVNAISWLSRPVDDKEPMYESFKGKAGLVISASPGGLGGMRGLRHLRELLTNIGTKVVPEQVAIGGAYQAFNETGDALKNDQQEGLIQDALQRFFEESRSVANADAVCRLAKKFGEYGEITVPTKQ